MIWQRKTHATMNTTKNIHALISDIISNWKLFCFWQTYYRGQIFKVSKDKLFFCRFYLYIFISSWIWSNFISKFRKFWKLRAWINVSFVVFSSVYCHLFIVIDLCTLLTTDLPTLTVANSCCPFLLDHTRHNEL